MIEEFQYITDDGIDLKVNLGIDGYIFENNKEELVAEFYKRQSKGIKWLFNGKEIRVFEVGCKISGYPTSDLENVVIIYPSHHKLYPALNNAVIYKENGTIYKQLRVPELISLTAKERKGRVKYNISDDASFRFVNWSKDSQGNLITALQIDFDWEWWESRVLNPETGEFGECISSGRR